jgi:hypothetical protein
MQQRTNIDATDLACLLAGLRLLQREMGYGYDVSTMPQFAESDPPLEPPDAEYLDELCERINCADVICLESSFFSAGPSSSPIEGEL